MLKAVVLPLVCAVVFVGFLGGCGPQAPVSEGPETVSIAPGAVGSTGTVEGVVRDYGSAGSNPGNPSEHDFQIAQDDPSPSVDRSASFVYDARTRVTAPASHGGEIQTYPPPSEALFRYLSRGGSRVRVTYLVQGNNASPYATTVKVMSDPVPAELTTDTPPP